MKKYHEIGKIEFMPEKLILIIDGKEYVFNIAEISIKLAKASENEQKNYQISPSGYGIHWPLLDEDLSIDSLLGIKHMPLQKMQVV